MALTIPLGDLQTQLGDTASSIAEAAADVASTFADKAPDVVADVLHTTKELGGDAAGAVVATAPAVWATLRRHPWTVAAVVAALVAVVVWRRRSAGEAGSATADSLEGVRRVGSAAA